MFISDVDKEKYSEISQTKRFEYKGETNMERERKFLINQLPKSLWKYESKELEQHYISFKPEVRIRKSDNDYTLTIKSNGNLERQEVEMSITKDHYDAIKQVEGSKFITKTRYIIPEGDLKYELDIYHNIKGLLTIEVEFETKEDAESFAVPEWFGDEVTNIKEFKNKNLALKGFPKKLTCPICKGKDSSYDRLSMSHHACTKCTDGTIDIYKIDLAKYNEII